MRVTIISDDGVVGIDGEFRQFDLSGLDPNIHAVQWDGATGHVEFKDRSPQRTLIDISAFQSFIDAWTAAAAAPPPPPPSEADRAESEVLARPVLLALGRIVTGNDALTEDDLVTLVRAKLP